MLTVGALATAMTLLFAMACAGEDTTVSQAPAKPVAASAPAAAAAAVDPSAPAAPGGTTATTSGSAASAPAAPSAAAQAQFDAFPEDGMPQYGGILRLSAAEPFSLSSLDNASPTTTTVHQQTMDHLLRWDWYGDYRGSKVTVPGVAKSWDINKDGTVWTFHLRNDVKWHDGNALTCADFKATYDFMVDPGEYGPPGASYVKPFVDTTACPDPYTLVLNLKGPAAALLLNLAYSWVTIYPAHKMGDVEWFVENNLGSGPFIFQNDKRDIGIRYETARNPNYWDEGLPYLDGVRSFIIEDAGSQLAAFETKRIDTGGGTPTQQAELMARYDGQMELVKFPAGGHSYILWNVRKPPFDDPKVRKAMYLWMDRAPFLEKSRDGRGFIMDWMNPNWNGGYGMTYDELVKNNIAYNPDKTEARKKALEILDGAGWSKSDRASTKIDVMSRYTKGGSLRGNQVLAAQLQDMGWDAVLRSQERTAGLKALRAGDFMAAFYGGSAGLPSADATLNRYLSPTGQRNYTGISDPVFMKLLEEYNLTFDLKKRAAKLDEIDAHLQKGEYSMHVMTWGATEGLQWNYLQGFDWMKGGWERSHYHVWLGSDAPGRQ